MRRGMSIYSSGQLDGIEVHAIPWDGLVNVFVFIGNDLGRCGCLLHARANVSHIYNEHSLRCIYNTFSGLRGPQCITDAGEKSVTYNKHTIRSQLSM